MTRPRPRKVCCCVPARIGVFILSVLTFLGGGFVAVLDWWTLSLAPNSDGLSKASGVISGLSWTFLVIASVIGFVGTFIRKRTLVAIYATALWIHFWFSLGISALSIAILFIDNRLFQQCVDFLRPRQDCEVAAKIRAAISIIITLVILAIQCYSSVIASRYAAQLKEEQSLAEDTGNATVSGNPQMSTTQPSLVTDV